ncbi:hypothetical protein ACFOG5_08970 [Pedobacter fastidiosus]
MFAEKLIYFIPTAKRNINSSEKWICFSKYYAVNINSTGLLQALSEP